MSYLISPPAPTRWHAAPPTVAAKLRSFQPEVAFEEPGDDCTLRWSARGAFGLVVGMLAKDNQTLVIEGDVRDCANYAVWFRRSVVPLEEELVFYDESYSADVAVLETTTARDLAYPFVRTP